MLGLGAFYQIWIAVAAMGLVGRAVLGGRLGPGLQILVGWGGLGLILTLWGVFLPWRLELPALAFLLLSPLGLMVGRARLRADGAELGRMLAVALPLLAVTATLGPSQPDALLAFIPKAAFLADHGVFPVQGGPPIHTDVPVAPYGTELAVFLAVVVAGAFDAAMPSLLGIALHVAAGLVLARVLAAEGRVGWDHAAAGLAMATLLNPGFVPRVSFAGYGEAPLSIALMAAGWLAVGIFETGSRVRLVALALVLCALVLVKQQGMALLVAFSGGLGLAVLRSGGGRRGAVLLGLAILPAVLLYAAWRYHVTVRFPEGELRPLPLAAWAWGAIPAILADMGRVVVRQALFFGLAAVGLLLALRPPAFMPAPARLAAVLFGCAFVLYNGFLFLTFIAHFGAEHSLYRYNTHLALLLVLVLLLCLRERSIRYSWWLWPRRLILPVMLGVPLVASPLLRFDLSMPQPRLRQLAFQAAGALGNGAKVAFVLPGDNGSVAEELKAFLSYVAPRRPDLDAAFLRAGNPREGLEQARAGGHVLAVLTCTTGMGGGIPDGAAALLAQEGGAWALRAVWAYDPAPARTWWNWTGFLAGEPLCL